MVYLIGAGMDGVSMLTEEAARAVEKAAILIGSDRMLRGYEGRESLALTATGEIVEAVEANLAGDVCVLFSGDALFFSAGAAVYKKLKERNIEAKILPGISSLSFFCSRIGERWSDAEVISAHGREVNLLTHIRDRERVFALLSSTGQIIELLDGLERYGMRGVRIYVGINLGYEDERILEFPEGSYLEKEKRALLEGCSDSLVVMFAVGTGRIPFFSSIEDEDFIRQGESGKVIPMTKKPVRTLCLEALRLERDSILYDVGAGTGSVSVAAALMSPDIRVYAFEKRSEACVLAAMNRERFLADNIEIIEGSAPEVFKEYGELPVPTHAFIGGGGEDLGRIIDALFSMNSSVRIVLTVISLTSLKVLMDYLETHKEVRADIMQVAVSRGRKAGENVLMLADNAIYIATLHFL